MVVPKRQGPRQDDGLFGPGSVAWEVIGHPVLLIGALSSAMVSLLYSEVAQSINNTGVTRTDPLRRLEETTYFGYTAVFGDTAEARRAGKFVQGKHNKVRGHDPVSGNDINPTRPDIAIPGHAWTWLPPLWAYETYVRKLTPAERARYWREGFAWAELVGIDTSTTQYTHKGVTVSFPQTEDEWNEFYESYVAPRLTYSSATRTVFSDQRSAEFAPVWARPLVRAVLAVAEEFALASIEIDLPRELLGGTSSQLRLRATRLVGRVLATGMALPPVRDLVEKYGLRGNGHELLTEAREIQRRAGTATPPERPTRVVAASLPQPSVVTAPGYSAHPPTRVGAGG